MTEVLQIKRREEGQALGAENTSPAATFKWNDNFWVDVYNQAASKFQSIVPKKVVADSDSEADGSTSSSDDDFDGELTIVKATKLKITKSIKKESKKSTKDNKPKKSKDLC